MVDANSPLIEEAITAWQRRDGIHNLIGCGRWGHGAHAVAVAAESIKLNSPHSSLHSTVKQQRNTAPTPKKKFWVGTKIAFFIILYVECPIGNEWGNFLIENAQYFENDEFLEWEK